MWVCPTFFIGKNDAADVSFLRQEKHVTSWGKPWFRQWHRWKPSDSLVLSDQHQCRHDKCLMTCRFFSSTCAGISMKQHEKSLTIRSRQHQADSRNIMLVLKLQPAEIQLTKSWKISRYFVHFGLREVAPSTVNLARGAPPWGAPKTGRTGHRTRCGNGEHHGVCARLMPSKSPVGLSRGDGRGRVAAENGGDGRSWGWSKHRGVCWWFDSSKLGF